MYKIYSRPTVSGNPEKTPKDKSSTVKTPTKIRVSSLGDVEGPKEARRLGTLSWANYDTE